MHVGGATANDEEAAGESVQDEEKDDERYRTEARRRQILKLVFLFACVLAGEELLDIIHQGDEDAFAAAFVLGVLGKHNLKFALLGRETGMNMAHVYLGGQIETAKNMLRPRVLAFTLTLTGTGPDSGTDRGRSRRESLGEDAGGGM